MQYEDTSLMTDDEFGEHLEKVANNKLAEDWVYTEGNLDWAEMHEVSEE